MLAPAAVAWMVCSQTSRFFWRPAGFVGAVVFVAELVVVGTGTVVTVGRVTRRLLPLASLMTLSLVFPDEAPSRYKTAMRSGTIRNLQA